MSFPLSAVVPHKFNNMRRATSIGVGAKPVKKPQEIAIWGNGHIGSYIASQLLLAQNKVTLIGRPDVNASIVKMKGKAFTLNGHKVPTKKMTLKHYEELGKDKFKYIIVCVKHPDIESRPVEFAKQLRSHLAKDGKVVVAMNGYWVDPAKPGRTLPIRVLDKTNLFLKILGKEKVTGAVVGFGTGLDYINNPVRVTGPSNHAKLTIGNIDGSKENQSVKNLCNILSKSGFDVTYNNKAYSLAMFQKLAANSTNLISAIFDKNLGEMCKSGTVYNVVLNKLLREFERTGKDRGIIANTDNNFIRSVKSMIKVPPASYYPSTHHDILLGKKTEYQVLVRVVSQLAGVGIHTPYTDHITKLMKKLQKISFQEGKDGVELFWKDIASKVNTAEEFLSYNPADNKRKYASEETSSHKRARTLSISNDQKASKLHRRGLPRSFSAPALLGSSYTASFQR